MTNSRRFQAGDRFLYDGIWYRLVPGRKGPDDLRLEWACSGFAWRPVTLDHAAIMVDAIGENENYLYPPPYAGAGKVWQFVIKALREGWRQAVHDLHLERDHKNYPELYDSDEAC